MSASIFNDSRDSVDNYNRNTVRRGADISNSPVSPSAEDTVKYLNLVNNTTDIFYGNSKIH